MQKTDLKTEINSLEEATQYFISLYPASTMHRLRSIKGIAKWTDRPPGKICNVLVRNYYDIFMNRKTIKYFLIFRPHPFNGWAGERFADIPEMLNVPGLTVSCEIISNVVQEVGDRAFVLVLGNKDVWFQEGELMRAHDEQMDSFTDRRTKMEEKGFWMGLFTEKDPFG